MKRLILAGLAGVAFLMACNSSVPTASTAELSQAALTAINKALELDSALPAGTRVLEVLVTPDRTTLNFSSEAVKSQQVRLKALDVALTALLPVLDGQVRQLEVQALYAGRVVQAADRSALHAQAFECAGATRYEAGAVRTKPSSITGAKVMLNPGHGFYRKDSGSLQFQRPAPNPNGTPPVFVLEDTSNLELAIAAAGVLTPTGVLVSAVRNLDKNAGVGSTGKAKWEEAAIHHLGTVGFPEGVWNSEGNALTINNNVSDCAQGRDVRARAWAANYWGADALVGIHSNASPDASARGTRIYFPNTPFLSDTPGSTPIYARELARLLGNGLRDSIRSRMPGLNWPEPILLGSDDYGETGYAKMPSVIVEVGFHTNPIDGAALGQDAFRLAVAEGIKNGLTQFFGPAVAQNPVWQTTPNQLTLNTVNVGSSSNGSFVLKNAGATGMYSIASSDASLSVQPLSASLATATTTTINVSGTCSSSGQKSGVLTISGGGSSIAVNVAWSCLSVAAGVPITPSPLTVTMSSNGRLLLAWPEVSSGAFYEFKAMFADVEIPVTGRASTKGSTYGGAVATFTDNPSATDKNGKQVCLAVRAVNTAGQASAFSAWSCRAYQFYSNGIVIQGSGLEDRIFLGSR
jgi:N-acetylmuramoyl-L-alanine amidase